MPPFPGRNHRGRHRSGRLRAVVAPNPGAGGEVPDAHPGVMPIRMSALLGTGRPSMCNGYLPVIQPVLAELSQEPGAAGTAIPAAYLRTGRTGHTGGKYTGCGEIFCPPIHSGNCTVAGPVQSTDSGVMPGPANVSGPRRRRCAPGRVDVILYPELLVAKPVFRVDRGPRASRECHWTSRKRAGSRQGYGKERICHRWNAWQP